MSILARSMVVLLVWCLASSGGRSTPFADSLMVTDPDSAWVDSGQDAEEESREQELDDRFEEGRDALDDKDWAEAVRAFDAVTRGGGRNADRAFYYMAYALTKQGRRTEALSALEKLRSSHPNSRYLDDAKALELEIRQGSGQAVSPDEETSEDLKLLALNTLMNMDDERAVPMLEKFLAGTHSPKLKEQALFILVQTGSPRARETVSKIARGQMYPGLQRKAIENLGIFGGREASSLLQEIYASAADEKVKKAVLNSYMISGDTDALLAAATGEKDLRLRKEAIQLLGAQGARDELLKLYRSEPSIEVKEQILQALGICGSSTALMDLARSEKDPRMRIAAVKATGITGGGTTDLISLYWSDKDVGVRKAAVEALFTQGEAGALVEIARKERDPEMRKEVIEKLSVMGSEEAIDFLLELLEK